MAAPSYPKKYDSTLVQHPFEATAGPPLRRARPHRRPAGLQLPDQRDAVLGREVAAHHDHAEGEPRTGKSDRGWLVLGEMGNFKKERSRMREQYPIKRNP